MTQSPKQSTTPYPYRRAACYDWAIRDVLKPNPSLIARLSRVRVIATVLDRTLQVMKCYRGGAR